MRIELLHIADCPNTDLAAGRLRAALDASGLAAETITLTELDESTVLTAGPFAGSPTIVLDGTDLFPSDGQTSELACRVYPTAGGLAGSPTLEQLVDAIAKHRPHDS